MTATPAQWLKIREATDLLGVSTATLRRWADAGHIQAFTTPGGHRRFDRADVLAMLPHVARRARPHSVRDVPVDPARCRHGRDALRCKGQQIIELLRTSLDAPEGERRRSLDRAFAIAARWGRVPGSAELTTRDAVEVLNRLRGPFLRELAATACRQRLSPAATSRRLIAATAAMDRMLETCIDSHDAARSARPETRSRRGAA